MDLTPEQFRDADWDKTTEQLDQMQALLCSLKRVVPYYSIGEGVRHRHRGTGHVTQRRTCECDREWCSGTLYTVRYDNPGSGYQYNAEYDQIERCPEADSTPIIDFPQAHLDGKEHWHYYWISHNAWLMHGSPWTGYRFSSFWEGGSIGHEQVFGRLFRALIMQGDLTFSRHGIDLERKNQPRPR